MCRGGGAIVEGLYASIISWIYDIYSYPPGGQLCINTCILKPKLGFIFLLHIL